MPPIRKRSHENTILTRPLLITQVQVAAICRGAAKAGFVAELTIGEVTVRLMPEAMVNSERPWEPKVNKGRGYL